VGPAVKLRVLTVLLLSLVLGAVSGIAADSAHSSPVVAYEYHSVIPLGSDNLLLLPAKLPMFLMVSAESPEFEGWREVDQGARRTIYAANGAAVRNYPASVTFRVTASTKIVSPDESPYPVACHENVNNYLLRLRFRLKVFRGLQYIVLQPETVRLIGVPPDVNYDERIYRVKFTLPDLPLENRLMFEVLSPRGERISKFHLEFN
jgi:hypothetical protein